MPGWWRRGVRCLGDGEAAGQESDVEHWIGRRIQRARDRAIPSTCTEESPIDPGHVQAATWPQSLH
eukprot:2431234-Pleurochrysis_carterae.AAC.1